MNENKDQTQKTHKTMGATIKKRINDNRTATLELTAAKANGGLD